MKTKPQEGLSAKLPVPPQFPTGCGMTQRQRCTMSKKEHRRPAAHAARRLRAALETLERRVLMAAGDVDPTFGTAGVAAGKFGATAAVFDNVAVLPDGKILAAGTRSLGANGSAADFLVARYN